MPWIPKTQIPIERGVQNHIFDRDQKKHDFGAILVWFWVPFRILLASSWSPIGIPEAVLLEVEILMAKRVKKKLAAIGSTWQDLAEIWVPGP